MIAANVSSIVNSSLGLAASYIGFIASIPFKLDYSGWYLKFVFGFSTGILGCSSFLIGSGVSIVSNLSDPTVGVVKSLPGLGIDYLIELNMGPLKDSLLARMVSILKLPSYYYTAYCDAPDSPPLKDCH